MRALFARQCGVGEGFELAETRVLQMEFASEEALRAEYRSNISNGGMFVATTSPFSIREPVCVRITLAFSGEDLALDGEVVHVVPAQLKETGATPGVAVHFSLPVSELRERFWKWVSGDREPDERTHQTGRRAAPRAPARVPTDIEAGEGRAVRSRTRNLSASGVLVAAPGGEPVPVGSRVMLGLTHPITRERRRVAGRVVRHASNRKGEITGFAVEFEVSEAERPEFERFVGDLKTSEHSRRLGGIKGAISEIGIVNVLQMFGSCSPQGTLHVVRQGDEGVIAFERGTLRAARLGSLGGIKALTEMMSWTDGRFEFQSRLDDDFVTLADQDPIPLEAAILDAVRRVDEIRRERGPETAEALDDALVEEILAESRVQPDEEEPVDPASVLRWCGSGDVRLTDTEQSLRELAEVGMTVGKALSVIPEPEADLRSALTRLIRRGLITLD